MLARATKEQCTSIRDLGKRDPEASLSPRPFPGGLSAPAPRLKDSTAPDSGFVLDHQPLVQESKGKVVASPPRSQLSPFRVSPAGT